MINERLNRIRELMTANNLDMYFINTSDYHNSEYLGDYFKTREYMSGFTGSQGSLLISHSEAWLWVDGRYYIQAEKELENTEIELMKMGMVDVPEINAFISKNINGRLGLDGKCLSVNFVNDLKHKSIDVLDIDLVSKIWNDRPDKAFSEVFELSEDYSGKDRKDKIAELLEKLNSNVHVVNSLDQICWLLNIRAKDIKHTPVVLSYLLVKDGIVNLFIDQNKLNSFVKDSLIIDGILIHDYDDFYDYLKKINNTMVLMDYNRNNYATFDILHNDNIMIDFVSPIELFKAVKNETEINNTIKAHIKDGIAMTNFIYYIKHLNGEVIDEYEVKEYVDSERMKVGAFDLSFSTISAYKENAAIMHYGVKKETAKKIEGNGLLLVDSGGQYLEGTTDITRTILVGKANKRFRKLYTKVLKGHVDLAKVKFLYGCSGMSLDILARSPMWQMDIDYQSGTGHGVGHILGVHEGPQGFRWKISPLRKEGQIMEAGMITTDEPGIYLKDDLGIRIENELLCIKGNSNEYGQFMEFESITCCPYDRALINPKYLDKEELKYINKYQKYVYQTLKDYLSDDVRKWLKKECKEIK